MPTLTPAQWQTFKADMLTNQAGNITAGDHGAISAYYNAAGTGNIWRPSIDIAELNTAIVWADFAGRTAAQRDTYLAMISPGFIDATSSNIRDGFTAVFGAGSPSLTQLAALAQRTPTRFEQLFTTNAVSAVFGQSVSPTDVAYALSL